MSKINRHQNGWRLCRLLAQANAEKPSAFSTHNQTVAGGGKGNGTNISAQLGKVADLLDMAASFGSALCYFTGSNAHNIAW